MTESNEPVNGTVAIDNNKTNLQENDVVFEVRTADGDKLHIATSPVATKQLQNEIISVLENENLTKK